MQILLPKKGALLPARHPPVFFLAGPVRGGGDWHQKMTAELARKVPDCLIAIPQRYLAAHPLMQFLLSDGEEYSRQTTWERAHLEMAAWGESGGCIVFWLCCESKTHPHPGPEPYSMDTRGELGRWSVHKKYRPKTRMVVGAEPAFHGLSQIQCNLNEDLGRKVCIYNSIRRTAAAAVKAAHIS